jgi:hypothetical protein
MRRVRQAAKAILLLLAMAGGQAALAAPLQKFEAQLDVRCDVELDWLAPVGTFRVNCDWGKQRSSAPRVTEGRTYQLNAILSPANKRLEDPASELKEALADIFEKPEEAAQADCHLASMIGTVCRNVPAGASIKKRAGASDAFSSTTGYVMCADSAAGRGPCAPMKPK